MLLGLGSDVAAAGNDGGGGGIGREKRRGSGIFDNLDKAAQKKQRRMIKNRESAAWSRERKQAAQAKERLKLFMEKIIPVVEQRKPPQPLRRVHSWEW